MVSRGPILSSSGAIRILPGAQFRSPGGPHHFHCSSGDLQGAHFGLQGAHSVFQWPNTVPPGCPIPVPRGPASYPQFQWRPPLAFLVSRVPISVTWGLLPPSRTSVQTSSLQGPYSGLHGLVLSTGGRSLTIEGRYRLQVAHTILEAPTQSSRGPFRCQDLRRSPRGALWSPSDRHCLPGANMDLQDGPILVSRGPTQSSRPPPETVRASGPISVSRGAH